MSKQDCIYETLFESLNAMDINITHDQLNSLVDDVILSVDLFDEHSSPRYDYPNPYKDEAKELRNQVNGMYSKSAYDQIKDDLEERNREHKRLHNIIEDLRRENYQLRNK